jgi:hypothetical protein
MNHENHFEANINWKLLSKHYKTNQHGIAHPPSSNAQTRTPRKLNWQHFNQ